MIKNYKKYNEGILNKLKGPTDEEFYDFLRTLSLDEIMMLSVKDNNMDLLKLALEYGANIHYDDDKAIVHSIGYKNYEMVDFLLSKGANKKIAITTLNVVKILRDYILPPHLDKLANLDNNIIK